MERSRILKRPKPAQNELLAPFASDGDVPLKAIVCTEELDRRPARPADYETENRALATLVQSLADSPRTILQTLANTILEMLNADSAGMSLLTRDEKRFELAAAAGAWEPHLGRDTPRDFGPCGDVLDRNAPLLFKHWERRYPYLREATPLAEEALLLPFHVNGKAVGTIWAISHDPRRKFDAEDLRQLTSFSRFAAAAYQAFASLDVVDQRRAALNLMEDAVQSRHAMETLNLNLRESEERYRTLFDLGPVAIYSCDAAGVIRNFNHRATELWGRTPACGDTDERFCGSFKLFRSDGSFMPHEQCPMAKVVSGRTLEVSDEEVHIERPDGSRITVVVSIRPLKSARGEITGAINCFYDITERKQAEQNLSEAARRFRFLAESMPQKIFTAKPNGELDYLNQQWVEYTGLVFEQIKECGWKTFIHPEDLPENLRTWQHSIDSGEPFRFEHRFRRADGNYRWHLSRAVAMRDSNGNIRMWIGSNTDIQDVREQEDRLRKIEKMAAAGQLASSIAHEVNNPLSSVTNSLYLLENHANLDESARFYVSIASTELARVSRIVKQSLSYYRAGTVPGDVDLDAIVNESLNIFSEKLKRTGIELKPKVDSGAALVGFPDELRQVVDNLLLNALEAMPGGGRLSISVHESYDWTRNDHKHRKGVRLTIADTGCGIPKDILAQVFEPFFTTKTEKGTGLGLWILQGIISKHEGIMSLRSSDVKGKSGTVISIFFPSPTRASRTSKFSEAESAA
jgi:PAS domain S-box-containing protein